VKYSLPLPALAWALALCVPAGAVITRLYPLKDIIGDADLITAAQVKRLDRKRHVATLVATQSLKGKSPWKALQLRLAGSDDRSQTGVLEARLPAGRTVLLFTKLRKFTLAYADGTWFRVAAPQDEASPNRQFVHLELYLRRTFRGSSAEMQRLIPAVLAGKAEAPPPDPEVKPGYGA